MWNGWLNLPVSSSGGGTAHKTGNDRWYEEFVPVADKLLDEHLAALKKEAKNRMHTDPRTS